VGLCPAGHRHFELTVNGLGNATIEDDDGVPQVNGVAIGHQAIEQHVLTASRRIGIASEHAEDERHGGRERRPRAVEIRVPAARATLERREHVKELAGVSPGCDDANA
jgi:hypothetical protein